jgi:hypothetical protein
VFNTNTTPKSVSVAVTAGDRIVIYGMTGNDLTTIGVPTDGVNTYAPVAAGNIIVTDFCAAYMWTTTAGTSTTLNISATRGGSGGDHWGLGCFVHNGSDGIGASAKGNVNNNVPSVNITTTQVNSALMVISADWNALTGARTWRTVNGITPTAGNTLETTYVADSGVYTVYAARYDDAGTVASKTVGLTAPTAEKYSCMVVEVKGSTAGTDVNVADTPTGGMRMGASPTSVTADVTASDTPSGMRMGASPATVSVDVSAADVPSGIRLGQSTSTVSVGVTSADNPSGMRLGSSPASVTTAVVTGDSPSGMRLGSSSALVSFDVLVLDTPSGMRLGASPIVGVVTDSGATDANPSGMRLGQSPATVNADVVAVDDSHAGMRLGQSPATGGVAIFAGDTPSGMRLGQSTATVVVDVRVADVPNGQRLGSSSATVAVSLIVVDTPSGMRLGLSPATVTTGGVSSVTVADQPSGMRLGSSPVQVIISVPTLIEPTIFATVGFSTIDARSRPFVFDASVGVNVHAIVGSAIIAASPD